jgi:hypothetical protein
MKPRLLIVIIASCCFRCAVFSQTAESGPVFQSWNEVQLILPLVHSKDTKGTSINRVTATFGGILRFGRTSDLVDRRTGVIFDFRINRYLSFASGVLYRKDELVKNSPHAETRLDVGGVLSATWHNFSVRDRNLFEHRVRNGRADANLYRQRIQVSHPLKHNGKMLFSPFISDEGYFDIGGGVWVQNEFYAGITRRISNNTSVDMAYLRNDSKPANVNGLSLTLKITLR